METIFVIIIFIVYLSLWSIKRLILIKKEKIDPQVLGKSKSNIQKYMNIITKIIMVYICIIIPFHALNLSVMGLFERIVEINNIHYDITGFILALTGLSFCLYAQIKMGKSWRVGIDNTKKTDLVTTGLYSIIRNPTYLGLFLVCIGIFIIWPTIAIFIFSFTFILFLEIQVRCEEDFLENEFKSEYIEYKSKTKRYIPFIY